MTAAKPVKLNVPEFTQTEVIAFAGSLKGTPDTVAYDKQSQEHVRQPSDEKLSSGARKARRLLTVSVKGSMPTRPTPSQASRKAGKGGPGKAEPSQIKANTG